MKSDTHPELKTAKVTCTGCGNTFETLSILEDIQIGICHNCHPFFTGQKKLVDTEGRIEKFKRRQKDSASKKEQHKKKKEGKKQESTTEA